MSVQFPNRAVKVCFLGVGVSLALLIALWCVWAGIAQRRLAREIEEVHARNEPLEMSDFDTEGIPDSQNAAKYYVAAYDAMNQYVYSPGNAPDIYVPLSPAWLQLADAAVAANPKTLALLRRARQFNQSDWGFRQLFATHALLGNNSLNATRAMTNLVADASLQAHAHGDDREALERVEDTLHLAESVGAEPSLITRLVAIGEFSLAGR